MPFSVKVMGDNQHDFGSGSVYKKNGYFIDRRTGEKIPHVYYQAAQSVRTDDGKTKRVTGSSQVSARLAREALRKNLRKFYKLEFEPSPEVRQPRVELPKPAESTSGASYAGSVSAFLEEWLASLVYDGPSETVLRKYRGFLTQHVTPYIGDVPLAELNDKQLKVLFGETLVNKKKIVNGVETSQALLGDSARRNVFKVLNTALKYAVKRGDIPRNPLALLKAPRVIRNPDENVAQQAHVAMSLLKKMKDDQHEDYCRFLLQFLGLRRAERLGLTLSNIKDLTGKDPKLVINQQLARYEDGSGWYIKPRTKMGEPRTINVPQPFLGVLRAYVKERKAWAKQETWNPEPQFADLLFLKPNGALITLNRDNQDWHELLEHYGYEYWRAHLNRHITATLLADQQPPVSLAVVATLLGNGEAMATYYARVTNKQMKPPMQTYGETSFGFLLD